MSNENSFGRLLRQGRRELDLTQEQLADLVGCSPVTLRKMEAGTRRPSKELAEQLAKHLNLSQDDGIEFVRRARALRPGTTGNQFAKHVLNHASSTLPVPEFRPLTNIPAPITSFIGREAETTALATLVLNRDVRLLSLVGPPGIGKTRLGLRVSEEMLPYFEHGVYVVFLASITEPELVVPTIAAVLEVRESPGRALMDALKFYLRTRSLLLLLDNFEQVQAAAPYLTELLETAANLRIIVTSRAPLQLYGEHLYHVQPMQVPGTQTSRAGSVPTSAQDLASYEGIKLFEARAKAVDESFTLAAGSVEAVAQICRSLDGLPLAIELAAARCRFLPPAAMLTHLQQKLDLLSSRAGNLTPRQQTLRGAIGWSYDLLSVEEQALFARLSVFPGSFTIEAAHAIGGEEDIERIAETLPGSLSASGEQPLIVHRKSLDVSLFQRLVEQSLVQEAGSGWQLRYYMLETIREYASERLAETAPYNENQALLGRHALFYVSLAEQATTQLTSSDQAAWMERLDIEHDNFRAALRWAIDEDEVEIAARLGGALWRFWYTHGHGNEGRQWLELVLNSLSKAAIYQQVPPEVRARVVHGGGILERMQGNYVRADELLRESLALRRELDNKEATADTLNSLGLLATHQANYAAARAYFEEALALFQMIRSNSGMAKVLSNFAEMLREQGEYDEATPLLYESMRLNRILGNKRAIADTLNSLGLLSHYANKGSEAVALLEQALVLYKEAGVRLGVANVLCNMGDVAMAEGDFTQADELVGRALAIHMELGDKRYISGVMITLAQLALHRRDYEASYNILSDSLHMRYELGNKLGIAECLAGLAATGLAAKGVSIETAKNALFVCGAVSALLSGVNASLEPGSRRLYDATLCAVAQALSKSVYDEVWLDAHSASLEDITEAALRLASNSPST